MDQPFDWDEEKNLANQRKHGISFIEAIDALTDPYALVEYDESHSHHEDRLQVIGMSSRSRILFVISTERGETTRIISARTATSTEKNRYENQPR